MTHSTPVVERKARKAHQCEWCFEAIPAGEKYQRSSGTYEGYWWTVKAHPECLAAERRERYEDHLQWDESASWNDRHLRGKTRNETEAANLEADLEVTP